MTQRLHEIATIAFYALLAAHVLHSLIANRRPAAASARRAPLGAVLTQAPLFFVSCYLAADLGAFSRQLISPVYIALGVVAGHLIFCASLMATHGNLRDVAGHLFDLSPLWDFITRSPLVLMRFLSVAVGEELIWRVAGQTLLIQTVHSVFWGVIVIALAFSVVHKHFFVNSVGVSLEFLGFALLIGALYLWTGSLILVIAVHAVRDIEIAYLEYLVKVDELGDEDKALEEFERSLLRRPVEKA